MSPTQPATVDTKEQAPARTFTWVDFALLYAQRGWPIFPVHIPTKGECSCGKPACTNKGKHPRTAHGFYDATTDVGVIRVWGEFDFPTANVGIRTGKESGLVLQRGFTLVGSPRRCGACDERDTPHGFSAGDRPVCPAPTACQTRGGARLPP